jgi:7,8-dihydropterin-6-yl-methyl-4-(beta-D-ribofuranosyl)aminobenzene 5'-phosphate synthase
MLIGHVILDLFKGEFATCFNVANQGLVVIGSCCHAGVINTVKQAQAVSGVQQVHAVIGGFHLFQAADAYVADTVAALREINPDHVIPMHCSGDRFRQQVQAMLPDTLIESYVGTRYIFG